MEDLEIIGLYFRRNEKAITETAAKYGTFCRNIALNILSNREDAEECVNDTYLQAWNTIPPQKPDKLGAWLGRVIRNIAYNLWKKNHRQRRYTGMEEILNELEDCIGRAGVDKSYQCMDCQSCKERPNSLCAPVLERRIGRCAGEKSGSIGRRDS